MSITLKNLTKYYGQTKAVDNISFSVRSGEIVGLLGPNGAGKTTIARLITGYLAPSAGSIVVGGIDVRKSPRDARRIIGYLPEDNPLYPEMDVVEYLEFIAELQDVPRSAIKGQVVNTIRSFGLEDVKHIEIGRLSKGYRQRVGLAQALVHDPPALILDEPTNGLDPNQVREFRQFIVQVAKEKTVVLSSHALQEVQNICTRIIIIGKGQVLADSPVSDLHHKFHGRSGLIVEIEGVNTENPDAVFSSIGSLPGVKDFARLAATNSTPNTVRLFIESPPDADVRRRVFHLCVQKGWRILHLSHEQVRIEDIFHQLTVGR